jgi:hypothetical protein
MPSRAVMAVRGFPADAERSAEPRPRSAPRALLIAAPPRKALHEDVKACIIAEVDKDFTKQPVYAGP